MYYLLIVGVYSFFSKCTRSQCSSQFCANRYYEFSVHINFQVLITITSLEHRNLFHLHYRSNMTWTQHERREHFPKRFKACFSFSKIFLKVCQHHRQFLLMFCRCGQLLHFLCAQLWYCAFWHTGELTNTSDFPTVRSQNVCYERGLFQRLLQMLFFNV